MNPITQKRCANHPQREAAARCVACGRFFCRECITEHHEKMVCSACLVKKPDAGKKGRIAPFLFTAFRLAAGVMVLWLAFYGLGRALLHIPPQYFHGDYLSGTQPDDEKPEKTAAEK